MNTQKEFHDFSHRAQLGGFLNDLGLTGEGVEIGTLYGAYAQDILKSWRGRIHCVDPWMNQAESVYFDGANKLNMDHVFEQAKSNLQGYGRATLHRMMSLNAVGRFEDGSLDFVYLDGNHGIDSVRADIAAWWPKVKIGGIVSGHDFFTRYDHETNSDALTAVMELSEQIGVRPHVTWDTSWWFIKTEEADQKFREACSMYWLPRPVYTYNNGIKPVVVLPVARFDWNLAVRWLRWWNQIRDGIPNTTPVVVVCSPALTDEEQETLRSTGLESVEVVSAGNVVESGYFGSPNQMFKFGLDYCERKYPEHAIIWAEADTVPITGNWVERVMEEYETCDRPFMGDIQREGAIPHLTGNAVYHPNWRMLAPSLDALPGPVKEMGWDSQCAHDIVPRAHVSKTIQQIWRPKLPITAEWMARSVPPTTALFHQCKDGSMIDVLSKSYDMPTIPLDPALCESSYETDRVKFNDISPLGVRAHPAIELGRGGKRGGIEIMIVACKRDIEFLEYLIKSIKRYATGFSGTTLVVPVKEVKMFHKFAADATITTFDEAPGKGMMHHEVMVCRADILCPHADAVLHVDSDCLFWRPVTPKDYVIDGKYLMVRERYDEIAKRNANRLIWRDCVKNATGLFPEFETMVRHPNIYPVKLYGRVRDRVERHTKMEFDAYVLSRENSFPQGFAEFPTLGAVAIDEMEDLFHFVDYDHEKDARSIKTHRRDWQYAYQPERDPLVEGHSHSGMQRYRRDWENFLKGELPPYYLK